MKRIIAAASFALLAVPVFAAGSGVSTEPSACGHGSPAEKAAGAPSASAGASAKDRRASFEPLQNGRGVPPYTVQSRPWEGE